MKKISFILCLLLLFSVFTANAEYVWSVRNATIEDMKDPEKTESNFFVTLNIKKAVICEILYIGEFFENLENNLEDKSPQNQLKAMGTMLTDKLKAYAPSQGVNTPLIPLGITILFSSVILGAVGKAQKSHNRALNRINGRSIFDLSDNAYALDNNFDIMNQHMQMHMQAHNDALMQHMQMNNDLAMQQAMNEAMRSVTPFDHGGYVQGYGFNPSDTMAQDSFNQMNNMF